MLYGSVKFERIEGSNGHAGQVGGVSPVETLLSDLPTDVKSNISEQLRTLLVEYIDVLGKRPG